MIRPTGHGDDTIEHCQEWIAHHYAEPNPVRGMQERSGLPARTFKRRFRAATGYIPIEYVQTLRIEEAKHERETGDGPVNDGRWMLRVHGLVLARIRGGHHAPPLSLEDESY